jgi:DHA1 family inner membrane transport protein
MAIFTLGNLACALAPSYGVLMAARVLTSLAHGTFFGVGSVVATGLVAPDRRASAISLMFTGLTLATLLGVPAGTWLGHLAGWRATFWAVAAIGVLALVVIAVLVPAERQRQAPAPLRAELQAIGQPTVLLGLATTVLGFGGVFTVFTFVQPLLTRVSGFADSAVSPLLLVLGVGLIVGNLLGGRLADRRLAAALVGSLLALAVVLALAGVALHAKLPAMLAMGLFGVAAFATVAPLQLWVLHKAAGAPNLASSLNIGAFNLGNALGAWLGGVVIEHGPGLAAVPYAGALLTLAGAAVAMAGLRADRPAPARLAACER